MLQQALDLQQAMADISTMAIGDLNSIWHSAAAGATTGEMLFEVLPSIIDKYGTAAASWAADWYDELRDALGIGGRFTAAPAEVPDPGGQALVGWALNVATDDSTLIKLLEGGLQRRVVNFGRSTVMTSAVTDPHARGWQRLGEGKNCDFCNMLIGRGAVYTRETADFRSHDHCNCVAVPAFTGHAQLV